MPGLAVPEQALKIFPRSKVHRSICEPKSPRPYLTFPRPKSASPGLAQPERTTPQTVPDLDVRIIPR